MFIMGWETAGGPQTTSENPHQGPDRRGPRLSDVDPISGAKSGDLPALGQGRAARQGNRRVDLGDADRRRGQHRRRDPPRRSSEQGLVRPGDPAQQGIEGGARTDSKVSGRGQGLALRGHDGKSQADERRRRS